jgi:hypothetical protein
MAYGERDLFFSFGHFSRSRLSVTVAAAGHRVFLDFASSSVVSLTLVDAVVPAWRNFPNLTVLNLLNSTVPAAPILTVRTLISDVYSLAPFNRLDFTTADFAIGLPQRASVTIANPAAQISISEITANTALKLIGPTLLIGDFNLTWENATGSIALAHDCPGVHLSLVSIAAGISLRQPYLAISVSGNAGLTVAQGMWPEANYLAGSIGEIKAQNATVTLSNADSPIALDLTNSTLILGVPAPIVKAPVRIAGTCAIRGKSPANLTLQTVVLDNTSLSLLAETAGRIAIGRLAANTSTHFTFGGSACYSVGEWPDSLYNLTFSSLVEGAPVLANYDLTGASQVTVTGRVPPRVSVVANFTGPPPTDADIAVRMGASFTVFRAAAGTAFTVSFPRQQAHGFNSATFVFDATTAEGVLTLTLAHALRDFANRLCYNPARVGGCPLNYTVLGSPGELDRWSAYVRPSAQDLFFEIRGKRGDVLNLSALDGNEASVSVTADAPRLLFSPGSFRNVTLRNTRGVVLDQPFELIGNWTLINSTFDDSTVKTLRCDRLRSLTGDPLSIQKLGKCLPQAELRLLDADAFASVIFQKESIDFSGPTIAPLSIPVSEPTPLLYLTTATREIAFRATPNAGRQTLFFHLTTPGHTITLGDFPPGFNGLFAREINGLFNATDGVIPIDSVANVDVDLTGVGDIRVPFPFCLNTRLHPDSAPVSGVVTFEEAYFGSKTEITIKPNVTFQIINGYLNQHVPIKAPIGSLLLSNNLTIFAWSQFAANNFGFRDRALLHIVYRFGALPRVVLNRPAAHEHFATVVTFAHEGGGGEAEFVAAHADELAGLTLPVICGENLDCGAWTANWSAQAPVFNGTTSILKAVCETPSSGQQCFSIRFRRPERAGRSDEL